MPEYKPNKMKEVSVLFDYQPEEPQTWDDPGCPEDVSITDIHIHGEPISDELAEHLVEKFGDDWQAEIIQRAAEYKRQKRRI